MNTVRDVDLDVPAQGMGKGKAAEGKGKAAGVAGEDSDQLIEAPIARDDDPAPVPAN